MTELSMDELQSKINDMMNSSSDESQDECCKSDEETMRDRDRRFATTIEYKCNPNFDSMPDDEILKLVAYNKDELRYHENRYREKFMSGPHHSEFHQMKSRSHIARIDALKNEISKRGL